MLKISRKCNFSWSGGIPASVKKPRKRLTENGSLSGYLYFDFAGREPWAPYPFAALEIFR
jgi:hypothetical protein